ncbi:hypothetical protein BGZ83_000789 [Gryganskiella cystojenkinii]|nr:hypothetical protein BGZ83_000789 [Gryganskiella cystojenkinii]
MDNNNNSDNNNTDCGSAASKALDIPEIRLVLSDFLSPKDLTVCARVNKDFFQTFAPLIWTEATVRVWIQDSRSSKATTLTEALKHKTFIRSLTVPDLNDWRIRERNELWAMMTEFPFLRSLTFKGTTTIALPVKPESFGLIKPQFSQLTSLDFYPQMTLKSEMYDDILSGCPRLMILRGGNCQAKVLIKSNKPWVCLQLQEWTLCLDFGSLEDYLDEDEDQPSLSQATNAEPEASSSSSSPLPPPEVKEPVKTSLEAARRKEVYHEVISKMSLLSELQIVNLSKRSSEGLVHEFWVDDNPAFEKLLRQCHGLKRLAIPLCLDATLRSWIESCRPGIIIQEIISQVVTLPAYYYSEDDEDDYDGGGYSDEYDSFDDDDEHYDDYDERYGFGRRYRGWW